MSGAAVSGRMDRRKGCKNRHLRKWRAGQSNPAGNSFSLQRSNWIRGCGKPRTYHRKALEIIWPSPFTFHVGWKFAQGLYVVERRQYPSLLPLPAVLAPPHTPLAPRCLPRTRAGQSTCYTLCAPRCGIIPTFWTGLDGGLGRLLP